MILPLERSKKTGSKVEFITGVWGEKGLPCAGIKSGEAGCSSRGKYGVCRRTALLLPLCITNTVIPEPEDKVAVYISDIIKIYLYLK